LQIEIHDRRCVVGRKPDVRQRTYCGDGPDRACAPFANWPSCRSVAGPVWSVAPTVASDGPVKRRSPSEAIPTSRMIFPTTSLAPCAEDHCETLESPHPMRS
jgi:hypothetical protein